MFPTLATLSLHDALPRSLILASSWRPVARLVNYDEARFSASLVDLCDTECCPLVGTTGGTGPAPRDVTPEATEAVCVKLMPGFGELMRQVSLCSVPTAILSRQTAGIRGISLIVNLQIGRAQV